MGSSYWSSLLGQRTSRRRVLAGTSGAALAASILAACGSSDSGSKQETASLIAKVVDTTKQAKTGGILKTSRPTDTQTFHPFQISSPTAWHSPRSYSRLLRVKPGYLAPYAGEVEPDFAESFELSPDKLQITMKVRPNARFDPRPPTNARLATADDVIFTWKMYEAIASRRADIANSVNPNAPIVAMTSPDAKTVVIKMAFPDSSILVPLADGGERFMVLPKEADGGFDLKTEQRGSGPFMMTEYKPSVGFTYRRNPGYWETGKPLIDGMDVAILSEYAAALAQFKTGAVWTYDDAGAGSLIRPEDILPTKRAAPAIALYQSSLTAPTGRSFYGHEGGMAKSPFIDERVRQAFSMAMDRDLWIDTFFNVPALEAEGIPVVRRWNTAINASHEGWWLDPQGKDFGPNAKFYKHDIAEAKKLLAAAGFPNGVDTASHHIVTGDYGRDFPKMIEVILGMAGDAGLRIKIEPSNFQTDFRTKYADSKGAFDGLCYANLTATEVGNWMGAVYNSKGSLFKGFSPDSGANPAAGDATLDDLSTRVNREFDLKKRQEIAHELQRYEAKTQYMPGFLGGASGIILSWPAVENRFVYSGQTTFLEENYIWINNEKAPIAKA